MAAKRVGKFSVDWADLASRVPSAQKSNYQAFKAKSDGFLRKVLANSEEAPALDWSYYKSNAANKAIVEQFEKLYTSTKIPYPDDKGAFSAVESEEKKELEKVNRFIQASNERIKKFQKEIEAIRAVGPYEQMTTEEFYHIYPNLALKPLTQPTWYPHTPEVQFTPEDLAYHRKMKQVHGPDEYHP